MRTSKFLFLIITIVFLVSCGDDDFPVPPASTVAEFSYEIEGDGFAPAMVNFTNESIIPEDAGEYSFQWTFGDGTTSSEAEPAHLYQEAGLFDVKLTIITEREIEVVSQQLIIQNPAASGLRVYFGDRNAESVKQALINDSEPAPSVISSDAVARPYSIAVDTVNDKLYYADFGTGTIYKADYDGKNAEIFRDELAGPTGLSINYQNNTLYWSTDTKIQGGSMESADEVVDVATGQTADPEGTFIDQEAQKIYWVTYDGGLWVKSLGGGAESELIPEVLGSAVIIHNNTIYYHSYSLDDSEHTIKTASLDGNILSTYASGMDGDVYGMFYEPQNNKIYWTDQRSGIIKRANPDGSGAEDWLNAPGTRIYGLALGEEL